jgi:pilin isopeptide linkage protein/LPXTG-motif cell wall-anchored protein
MNKKLCAYLSLLLLLGATFCTPAIAVAEMVSNIEAESESIQAPSATETQESTPVSETESEQSTSQSAAETSTSQQEKTTASTTPESSSAELNQNSIQPRAPSESTQEEVVPYAADPNLNARGLQLFDNVSITDMDDQPFTESNPPFYNDNVKIHFDWSLSDQEEIKSGDYYTYQLPSYFAVHNEVSGTLERSDGGGSLGEFYLSSSGELKIVFNEAAENLSGRSGTITLETELKVTSQTDDVVIETGIYDRDGKEILITLPIYQIDITKSGTVNASGSVVWEIVFNMEGKNLDNVVVTDKLPQGLSYSHSYGYLYDGQNWVRTTNLYTYNTTTGTFTFNQKIDRPVKIEINSVVNDTSIESFKNIAQITGDNFHDKSAEATVSYHESSEYKRFLGYDETTGRAMWEVSLDLSTDGAVMTDKTYSGTLSENALHYLVPDSIVVKNKSDNSVTNDWHFNEAGEIKKEDQLVQFQMVFDHAGQYIIRYETQLFDPVLTSTRITNYLTVKDDKTNSYSGSGTVTPTSKIGVTKTAVAKNYQDQTMQWQVVVNQTNQEIDNLVITDRYQEIAGTNISALELIEDSLVITATNKAGVSRDLDASEYELTKLHATTSGQNSFEYESGFQIKLLGSNTNTSDKFTVKFKTTFNIPKQIELGGSQTRFTNAAFAEYEIDGHSFTEAAQANSWLDTTWILNALKAGLFIPKGGDVKAYLQAVFSKTFPNVFSEDIASSDQVFWMGLFNTYKSTLHQGTVIEDQLQAGQTFREASVYSVEVSGTGNQVKSLKEKLTEDDYKLTYDPVTKKISIELLKDTSETIAVFIATDAAEDTFRYKNMISLTDGDTTLKAEAQVDKSAKDSWISKTGVQNTENNRLLDWEVLINQDSRTIKNAVVEDTINYNQQAFLYDETGKVIVDVYKAVKVGNQWEKGEKVTFNNENNPKVTTDGSNGTFTLSIAFEQDIDSPYFIVYQTKLDPGIRNNEIVSNDATLKGGTTEIHQVTKDVTVKSTNGSGTSTGTNGSLAIIKYDAESDKDSGISEEAHFQLSRQNAEGNYEIIFPDLIVKNNKLIQGEKEVDRLSDLRYGNYKIQETAAPNGYQRDENEYTFTISSQQVDYIFELANKKEARETSLALSAKKLLEGRSLKNEEFTFVLEDEYNNILQEKRNESEDIFFDEITYQKEGIYTYTIYEKEGNDPTIDYDHTRLNVKVEVKNVDGQLEANATYEGNAVFTNIYTPKAGSVVLEAEKVLTGRLLVDGEFTFELVDQEGQVIQSQTNDGSGKVYFDAIPYDKAGEYNYTIREKAGDDSTIDYDTTEVPVTVNVKDNEGQLEAYASYEGNAVFNNTYTPKAGSVVLEADKILAGRSLVTGEVTFELIDQEGQVIQSQTNDVSGNVYFDAISYDKAGEYNYTIREKVGDDSTITYDDSEIPVTVSVKDNAGQLEATASYEGNAVFTNDYTPKAGSVVLEAEKVLTGRSLVAGEFTFELVDQEGQVIQSQTNDGSGKVYFDAIPYEEAGDYNYTIREKAGQDDTVTYDDTEVPVTVSVKDNDGQLEATASYEGNAVFNNDYTPKAGSVVLEAEKVLTGRSLVAGEFTFELVDQEGQVIQSQTNDGSGKVYFDAIPYDKAGEYNYTIREKAGEDSTIDYDTTEVPVTVSVKDNEGQLEATATYEGNAVFTNDYTPKAGSVVLEAEKVLTGRSLVAGEFTFELVDQEGQVIQSQTNDGTGKIYFDAIPYEEAGDYNYTIREKAGEDSTIDYDTTEVPVTVNVKDNEGQLEAIASYEGNAVFNNDYTPTVGSVVLEAEKVLTGRSLVAGEFTFELVDQEGQVIQSQTNDGSGKVYFDAIPYDKAGEYNYTIREKAGEDSTIDYDTTEVPVTVSVKDNEGQLEATASYEGNAVFTNTYTPKAGSVVLEAEKVLTGRSLIAGEFTFELVNQEGQVIQSQTNDGSGKIYFDAIPYDKTGDYNYTIREKAGEDSTITYDDAEIPVTVNVKDKKGTLETKAAYGSDPTFTNSYTPEKAPDPAKNQNTKTPTKKNELPKTGETYQISWMLLGLLLVGIVVVVFRRQKRK